MTFTTPTTADRSRPFRSNRLLQGLAAVYAIAWLVLAIAPSDRGDWALENILTVAGVAALLWSYRRLQLSDLSYLLIALFLLLHAVGAHYTYAQVPIGDWMKDAFGLNRNHYDRVVHFAFGLLLAYPIREVLLRAGGIRPRWSTVLAAFIVMACSDTFEILESWIAQIVSPELGQAYLGTQGDVWDAQKDSTDATAGAWLAMAATSLLPRPSR